MATMEKPKQKKKKKVRTSSVADESAEGIQWVNADIEFPSTSTSDEIEIISQPDDEAICKLLSALPIADDTLHSSSQDKNAEEILSETQLPIENDIVEDISPNVQENSEHDKENDISTVEKIPIESEAAIVTEEIASPSAPAIEDLDTSEVEQPLAKLLYPNLKSIEAMAQITSSPTKHRLILQPFTNEQLKELYNNPEMLAAEAFESDFINTELNNTHTNHSLFELIKKYSRSRYNLKVNMLDLHGYIKCSQESAEKVWIIENRTHSYDGVCADGERVWKNERYEYAALNEQTLQKLSSSLNNTIQLVCYNFMTNLYACESYKTQIEQNIRELVSHSAFSEIRTKSPTALNKSLGTEVLETMREMRITISVLFSFLRRQVPDKEFSSDIKKWLEKIIAYYVRLATWQDHLFLIYHVLRCPPGIASWATPLIQIPMNMSNELVSFTSDEINHCITFLKVLLMPTKQRSEFLSNLYSENAPIDATTEDLWIIIDSDGEEDSTPTGECARLKETDLIALLNQVPFKCLFKTITFTTLNGDFLKVNKEKLTGYHLLKFIAFSTNLVELLGEGLKTYANEKYRQFAKLLSRLVRHAVQYVSDVHSLFRASDSTKDHELCARIQIEFDTFVLRSSNYIYLSRFLGAWQYLTILPFSELHIATVWKLYYMLTSGFSQNLIENVSDDFQSIVSQSAFLDRFNDVVVDVPAEDMYYLLQTFASMAMGREMNDLDFIRCITTDLFKVGFINAFTRDNCYKIVRDLLINITTKHTDLISDLLLLLKDNFKSIDKYGPYLFKALPLHEWRPPMDIFGISAHWLLNYGFESRESAMARTIFSHLNWNFDKTAGELFLPYEIHVRMASLIVDVSSKHVPETIGSSGISESVRQMSNLVKGQTPHQQFIAWCWNMVSVLRLHAFDQSNAFILRAMRNPTDVLRFVNELERLPSIAQGVSESRPIAVYISILTTMWGHSVPQICHKGFAQMQNLLNDYRYSTVIRCLQLVTPFFLECAESLCKCSAFQAILNSILQADRTYIRMAKDFISCDYPGPVVELFANMIQAQIIDYYNYDLQTPVMLITLWLNCLTVNPNWYKDPNSLFIVDVILRIAYQFPDAWITAKNFFKFFCKAHNELKSNASSAFIPFLGGSQPAGFFSSHSATTPWLALLALEIEHELFESETNLWPEIVRQLHASSGKFSMDAVMKNSAKSVGCASFSANSLVLYKLANLIINLPQHEELLPIFCQTFFHLYLSRIRVGIDEQRFTDVYGVADKFYDTNVSLMKKLKKLFVDNAKFEKERSIKSDDQNLTEFYLARSRLYNSFELWLEETRLNKILHLRLESFPPAYDLNRLAHIFANNTAHWSEFLQMSAIRQIQRDSADSWLKTCLRFVSASKHAVSLKKPKIIDSAENIVHLLNTYDEPLPPPMVLTEQLLIKKMSYAELKRNVLRSMQNDFKKLDELSRRFHMDVQELSSLDSNYKEMLRLLHENKYRQERRELRCGSLLSSKSCKGAAYVNVGMPYHEINEVVSHKLRSNRDRHEQLVNKLISAPSINQILPIVQIQSSIKHLLESYRFYKHLNDEPQLKEITTIASTFFYYMINAINENINSFHPAQDLCTVVLSQIGIFLQDNQNAEGMNLLKTAFKRPDLIKPISDLFVPSTTTPEVFLQLYKYIIDSHLKNCDQKILFVLLSKFDVNTWLTTHKPKLADINQLVQLILQGLESWNKNDSALIQGVLRRHLILIFLHDFPEHYGEVLLVVLKGCSENKLNTSILLELLNTIYKLANCPELDTNADVGKMKEDILYFATNQQLFSYRDLYETIALFARHFQNERLQHGLNGLYPIHKEYCKWLAVMFESFAHALVVSSVHANPGALSDTLVDRIWPNVCEMFSPWLFPYYPQNLPNLPANWIRQFNTPILLPWSELYAHYSQMMLHSFISCIQFMLDTFPACDLILSNIFYWYETNFGNVAVPRHVLLPTNASLILLPWNRLKPMPLNINGFHRLLQQYLPDCHSFLGHIFLRINWTPWLYSNIQQWDYTTRNRILSTLLLMFVKLSYEPNVRESAQLMTLLQEAMSFPWYLLDFHGIEGTFDWYVVSTEPSSILCLNSEHSAVDNSILSLLQTASSITATETEHSQSPSQLQSKRILYVKSIVRLLRLCGSKYQQLLTSPEGSKSFHTAIFNLLSLINGVVTKDNEMDGINMMIEIVGSIQLQGEFTSRIFVEAIGIWQSHSQIGNVLVSSTLNAIGTCKTFSNNLLMLLETTVFYYFRYLDSKKDDHSPSWVNVIERLGPILPTFDLQQMFDGDHLLCIYISMIYRLKSLHDSGEKITYLQNIGKMLENFKSSLNTESKLVIIWGLLITQGFKLLEFNSNAREPLLTLARHLKSTSNQSDGWGEGLLGAIGLKKDTVSNKRKIIAKCLACIIFSLFLDSENQRKEYEQGLEDLKNAVKSKKFADIRSTATATIDIVENQAKSLTNTRENICAVIRLFYSDYLVMSLEDVWSF